MTVCNVRSECKRDWAMDIHSKYYVKGVDHLYFSNVDSIFAFKSGEHKFWICILYATIFPLRARKV